MPAPELKFIAIKFDKMADQDETVLQGYIQRELTKRNAAVDEANTPVKQQREAFRVKFNNMKVKAITEATQKLPQQEFEVNLEDISVGGCCIGLNKEIGVAKNGTIYLTLHFTQPNLSVRGTILGLRKS